MFADHVYYSSTLLTIAMRISLSLSVDISGLYQTNTPPHVQHTWPID